MIGNYYYLIPETIVTSNFKQKKSISISDVDRTKFIICQRSPFTEISSSHYGVTDKISLVLYTKVPLFSETHIDNDLSGFNFLTDLTKVYKIVDVKKEFLTSSIHYIISVMELKQ